MQRLRDLISLNIVHLTRLRFSSGVSDPDRLVGDPEIARKAQTS